MSDDLCVSAVVTKAVPTINNSRYASFLRVKASPRNTTEKMNVNNTEVEERIVLLVTLVSSKEVLNVSWARYQRGAMMRAALRRCLKVGLEKEMVVVVEESCW